MLVEDERIAATSHSLEWSGYKVGGHGACSDQAIGGENKLDLVLMDVNLGPGGDAVDVITSLEYVFGTTRVL